MAKAAPAPKPAPPARPAPPDDLSPTMQAWWRAMVAEHELEPHRLHLLMLAARAFDRCEQARLAIAKDGTTWLDRFGAPRPRPEVAIERVARLAFARLVSAIELRATSSMDWPDAPTLADLGIR
jgi:hypothetical protein